MVDAVPVHEVMLEALQPVLRDVRGSGAPVPVVGDEEWDDDPQFASVMLWSRGGSGSGVNVSLTASAADRLARAADQVQEWVIEELWAQSAPTNWPSCPAHPLTHPLVAASRDGVAVWECPGDGVVVSPVGSLA